MVNTIMDHTGAPAHAWFLFWQYMTTLLNFTYFSQLKCTSIYACSTDDITILLYFYFWQPFCYRNGAKPNFLFESNLEDILLGLQNVLSMP